MAIARILNGNIAELLPLSLDDVPAHKRSNYRVIETEGSGDIVTLVFENDRAIERRTQRPITVDDIVCERERRLALGFDYNFGDARGVHHIGTTEQDLKGWDEVSKYAGALIDAGQTSTQISIATNTGLCTVTPIEWRAIEIKSAEFRQPLWAASFALMASNPIPADYANDIHWS